MDFLDDENTALLVIDVQNDFCPEGALAVPNGSDVIPIINHELMPGFNTVIATQDWHPAGHSSFASSHGDAEPFSLIDMSYGQQVLWPDHCIQNTFGSEFHKDLDISKFDIILRKGSNPNIDSYSAFFENDHKTSTKLADRLRERDITDLVICGLATDFCVFYSAMDAVQEGFGVTVALDACRAIDLNNSLDSALNDMQNNGINLV